MVTLHNCFVTFYKQIREILQSHSCANTWPGLAPLAAAVPSCLPPYCAQEPLGWGAHAAPPNGDQHPERTPPLPGTGALPLAPAVSVVRGMPSEELQLPLWPGYTDLPEASTRLLLHQQPVSSFNIRGHEAVLHPRPAMSWPNINHRHRQHQASEAVGDPHLRHLSDLTSPLSARGRRPSPMGWSSSGGVGIQCLGRQRAALWPELEITTAGETFSRHSSRRGFLHQSLHGVWCSWCDPHSPELSHVWANEFSVCVLCISAFSH